MTTEERESKSAQWRTDNLGKNSVLADVSGSPSFEDWLNKYFETPKMKMMYKRKDGKGEYDREKLIRDYKRAYRLS
jgi:hypothetical protein